VQKNYHSNPAISSLSVRGWFLQSAAKQTK